MVIVEKMRRYRVLVVVMFFCSCDRQHMNNMQDSENSCVQEREIYKIQNTFLSVRSLEIDRNASIESCRLVREKWFQSTCHITYNDDNWLVCPDSCNYVMKRMAEDFKEISVDGIDITHVGVTNIAVGNFCIFFDSNRNVFVEDEECKNSWRPTITYELFNCL